MNLLPLIIAQADAPTCPAPAKGSPLQFPIMMALLFAIIAIMGFVLGGVFFFNFLVEKYGQPFDLLSAGTIPLSNIAIGLKVGASLFLVILVLSTFRPDVSANKEE